MGFEFLVVVLLLPTVNCHDVMVFLGFVLVLLFESVVEVLFHVPYTWMSGVGHL